MIARGIASSQNLLLFLSHQLLCGWPSIFKKNTNTTRHNWFPCGWNKKNVHPKQIAMRQKLKRIFSCKLKPPNPVCKNVSDLVSTCTCRAMCTKRRIFFHNHPPFGKSNFHQNDNMTTLPASCEKWKKCTQCFETMSSWHCWNQIRFLKIRGFEWEKTFSDKTLILAWARSHWHPVLEQMMFFM